MNSITKNVIAASLLATALGAVAETYTVEVTLNSRIGEAPLIATQEVPMSYPELTVTDATVNGAHCVVDDDANSLGFNSGAATEANSLCPGATGSQAMVKFTGAKSAAITVTRTIPVQEQAGVRFKTKDGKDIGTSTFHLSAGDGTKIIPLASKIEMFDKDQVSDALLVFNYEITGAYQ